MLSLQVCYHHLFFNKHFLLRILSKDYLSKVIRWASVLQVIVALLGFLSIKAISPKESPSFKSLMCTYSMFYYYSWAFPVLPSNVYSPDSTKILTTPDNIT